MNLSTFDTFKHLASINTDENIIRPDDEQIKKIQAVVLSIAVDVISVCEKEGISYNLSGGTALGAIRHKGFIPWDDDFDINIFHSDLDRFTEAFKREFGDKYVIQNCHSKQRAMVVNKIRLKGSVYRAREDIGIDECGIFVDILPIENVSNNRILRGIHGFFCMGFGLLLSCRNFYDQRKFLLDLAESSGDKEIVRTFKTKINIGRLLSFMSVKKWTELTQWIHSICKNNKSKYVTIPAGRGRYFKEIRERTDFSETMDTEFEGHMWKISKNADAYMRSLYGDTYMQIPPESDRESHALFELKFPDE